MGGSAGHDKLLRGTLNELVPNCCFCMMQEQQHEIGRDLAALVQPSEQGMAQPHPEGETPEDEEEYDPEQGGMEF